MEIKINTILESLEEYVESKSGVVFTGNILVKKNDLLEYIKDIRTELPKSLSQASVIYEDRERIISDANSRAADSIRSSEKKGDEILESAKIRAAELLEEHQITQKAKVKAADIIATAEQEAKRIVDLANKESEKMKGETFDFVEEKISKLENTFSHARYNAEYLKDEFYKHGGSLFHILESNIDKEYEAVLGNKRAFLAFRGELEDSDKEDIDE